MKNYRKLIPLALVALMALSIYLTISDAMKERSEYNSCIEQARKLSKLGVLEDALTNYQSALEIRDTVSLRSEIGEMYLKNDWNDEAVEWGENMVELFPKDPESYNFLLKSYIATEEYDTCFSLRDEAMARDAVSDEFSGMMNDIEYIFDFDFESYDDVGVFGSGYCAVKKDDRWGYVSNDGNSVISKDFLWAGTFSSDNVAAVQDENGEYYYIDNNGNKKLAVQNLKKCSALGLKIGGVIVAADDGVYRYYDEDFKQVFKGDFNQATPMNIDAATVSQEGECFLIDKSGKRQTTEKYEGFIQDEKGVAYRNERAFARMDGQVYMINSSGKRVNKNPYEDAMLFFQPDSLAAVKINGLWGFVDKDGKEVIKPAYEEARSFSNGYAAVKIDGKWGFIDEAGKLVIKNQFQDAKDFNEGGCVFVKISEDWQLLKLLRNNYE